ncbi:MAG: sporulation protein Cse60 [Bacilli bacterium]|nr:sporulation protein Cse60 [Acholeplasmataceae bacterium]MDY2901999.1 sporulation protein Cse60 [Bacilli bacterium]
MLVKVFDESHELDLEYAINDFLKAINKLIDIKYSLAIMNDAKTNEQIYCYSALLIYE